MIFTLFYYCQWKVSTVTKNCPRKIAECLSIHYSMSYCNKSQIASISRDVLKDAKLCCISIIKPCFISWGSKNWEMLNIISQVVFEDTSWANKSNYSIKKKCASNPAFLVLLTSVEYRRINIENLEGILKLVQKEWQQNSLSNKKGKWLKFIPHFMHGKYYNYNVNNNRNKADKAWLENCFQVI